MDGINRQRHEPRKSNPRRPQVRRCRRCGKIIAADPKVIHAGRLCHTCEGDLGDLASPYGSPDDR